MASYRLPPVESVPLIATSEQTAILDQLFEPSPSLHIVCGPLLQAKAYSDYEDLVHRMGRQLENLYKSSSRDTRVLDEILGSHPRLGQKKVESVQSQVEQAQLTSANGDESKRLAEMNALYEETFPGLRYVVFVNGRSRAVIMEDMQARIDRYNIDQERAEAITAMCDIALDRAQRLSKGVPDA